MVFLAAFLLALVVAVLREGQAWAPVGIEAWAAFYDSPRFGVRNA